MTGSELVIILLVALIVLGPEKLPDAIRKFGRVYGELRRMSQGFQSELRDALDEPLREVRNTVNTVTTGFTETDGQTAEPRLAGPVTPEEHEAAAATARAEGDALPAAPAQPTGPIADGPEPATFHHEPVVDDPEPATNHGPPAPDPSDHQA